MGVGIVQVDSRYCNAIQIIDIVPHIDGTSAGGVVKTIPHTLHKSKEGPDVPIVGPEPSRL